MQELGVNAPLALRAVEPERVAKAVIDAIVDDRSDLLVAGWPMRPLFAIQELAPGLAEQARERHRSAQVLRTASRANGANHAARPCLTPAGQREDAGPTRRGADNPQAMKHFDGRASSVVSAPLATCFAALAAVDRYPSWSDFVREVVDVERDDDGRPVRAHVVVHVPQSPFGKRFEFDVAIRTEPQRAIHVRRLPSTPTDADRFSLSWSLVEDRGTLIGLDFSASVSFLPSLVPLPGVGNLIVGTLLDEAAAELGGAIAPAGRASFPR